MKKLMLLLLCAICAMAMYADDMAVESFKRLDSDMDARIHHPEKDGNGRTCAIIKVVNSNTGFAFDTGSAAVIKTRQETGEIWVYVQPGVKRMTVRHPSLGVLRDYYFNIPIEEATVYEMRLTTGTVHTYVEQKSTTAYLIVNSDPEGADVSINGEWVGQTPFSKKYGQGDRLQYRVSRPLYHDEVGEVVLDKTKCEVNASLKPAFGSISVTSHPAGAQVRLDDEAQPRGSTPLTIQQVASGQHRVRVQMPRYGQKVLDVSVADGETAQADAQLSASFAKITVNSLPEATITVDGKYKGEGSATWEQDAGFCDIEATLAGHRKQSRQLDVQPGVAQTITLEPIPMYGTLSVESTPIGADIYVDGKKMGTTPDVLEHVLAKEHTVRLSKASCADFTTTVTVKEGKDATVAGTLPSGETVSISAEQEGDEIYIDGEYVGKSPLRLTLNYGQHTAYARCGDKRSPDKSFDVKQGAVAEITLSFSGVSREFSVGDVTFRMIPVEGGTFTMGSTEKLIRGAKSDEKTLHEVSLSDYLIGETEVTQELWKAVMGKKPSRNKGTDLPVENIHWNDCQKFLQKLNEKTGMNFRLPTEAEWEFAAKGGNKANGYIYSGSDNIDDVAWYIMNSSDITHPVATKLPNELGIYDMSGNVSEWCEDLYGIYPSYPETNPIGQASGSARVIRGGSWNSNTKDCRISNRHYCYPENRGAYDPDYRDYGYGLRLALSR